MVIDG
jgi:[ribosomal protein S5]-alanine N-acetyltransferase